MLGTCEGEGSVGGVEEGRMTLELKFQSLGSWGLRGLWIAEFKGQITGNIRLERFEFKEIRIEDAGILGHLKFHSGMKGPRSQVWDNPNAVGSL